jgi:predicted nucleic acid-binding protein
LRAAGARILYPREGFQDRLLRQAAALGRKGLLISDLRIALIALEARAREIRTHDRRFMAVPGLTVFDPLVMRH